MRGRLAALALGVCIAAGATDAGATFRYGDIQISGNLETQNLFRLDRSNTRQLQTFDIVQQRNTVRLQYEHKLVKRGELLNSGTVVPFVKDIGFFAYYRGVYDSVYEFTPGPRFRTQNGSAAGKFADFTNDELDGLKTENVLREVFLDIDLADLPVNFRIGRQQIVWGSTINFRALDNANALDLTWHLQQEAGILGRVGFSELRIPSWAVKVLINTGTFGPLSSTYIEAYDIPFEFTPTKLDFYPRPWALPVRNSIRPGLRVDIGEAVGAPPGVAFVEPCFDTTGNTAANSEANPDFDEVARSGECPSAGLQRSRINQGLYDAHDPMDVNTFGVRFGGLIQPLNNLGFTLNYKYGRHIADATGGGATQAAVGALNARPQDFIALSPHSRTDEFTGRETNYLGFLRIPVEFYYPYTHMFGMSLDYFDEFTAGVWNLEVAAQKGVPISTVDAAGNGLNRKWEIEAALLLDRPTWIRFLNPRSTFTTLIQTNVSIVPGQEDIVFDESGAPINGDVGLPNSNTIPDQFADGARLDKRRQFEPLTIVAMQTFYWGGSLSPLVAAVWDWANMPAGTIIATVQWLPTPQIILEPTVRFFWTNGRIVDDRYSVSRNAGRSELQLKATYQF